MRPLNGRASSPERVPAPRAGANLPSGAANVGGMARPGAPARVPTRSGSPERAPLEYSGDAGSVDFESYRPAAHPASMRHIIAVGRAARDVSPPQHSAQGPWAGTLNREFGIPRQAPPPTWDYTSEYGWTWHAQPAAPAWDTQQQRHHSPSGEYHPSPGHGFQPHQQYVMAGDPNQARQALPPRRLPQPAAVVYDQYGQAYVAVHPEGEQAERRQPAPLQFYNNASYEPVLGQYHAADLSHTSGMPCAVP